MIFAMTNEPYETYTKDFNKESKNSDKNREYIKNFSGIMTADQYLGQLSKHSPLRSRDKNLDDLLGGGFRKGLVHLLIGPRKVNSRILLKTAVSAFLPKADGGLNAHKVVYIDGDNRFAPYLISQYALSMNLNPRKILSNIYVARAFNWSQMVEIAQIKLSKMDGVDLILISGLTGMFEIDNTQNNSLGRNNNNLNQKPFNDLKNAINGIKKAIANSEPVVVITAPKHKESFCKPVGGKILTHFGCVIIEIIPQERRTDYILTQHPFIKYKKVIKWNRITDQIMERYTRWENDIQAKKKNGKVENLDKSAEKKWKETINLPENKEFIKNVKNLRLKVKRNKTSNKNTKNKTQNLTLDYYLK